MTATPFDLAPGIVLGGGALPIIAGPCSIENAETTLAVGEFLADLAGRLGTQIVFKASYDKANRSSVRSYRGPGLEPGLEVLSEVGRKTGLPLLTDVHEVAHCEPVSKVCDVLQIPAFLCRQTDLVVAAAETGLPVNIKKGQFVAPEDMERAVEKARSTGNDKISVTERGTSFGYNNLVVDMRAFPILTKLGIPVIYDVTHSLQLPGGGEQTGGLRQYAEPLARAAVAAGVDGLYVEVHPNPDEALSDSTTQLPFGRAEALIRQTLELHEFLKGQGA